MSYAQTVLTTLIVYQLVLIGIGFVASRRTRDEGDFLLGGRSLGPWVASLSAAASSSSAWSLIGVAYMAYKTGLGAVWIFPATVGGFAFNWFVLAGPLRRLSRKQRSLTATELLALDGSGNKRRSICWLATILILVAFMSYVSAQYQAAGLAFQSNFEMSPVLSILVGAGIILIYTLLGGFWAVSLTDTLQGILMALVAILLPCVALVEVGGPGELLRGLEALPEGARFLSLTADKGFPIGLGLILGFLGIGLGYPGQPHVVNRFMAMEDARGVRVGRRITMVWAVILYGGMLLLGWAGRVLYPSIADAETLLFVSARDLLDPVLAGIVVAALLSAVMSTADSQLLVAASSISHDLRRGPTSVSVMLKTRLVVVIVSVLAVVFALTWPEKIFDKVLSAWSALGAAFGPLLIVRALLGPISERGTLWAMGVGFSTSLTIYFLRKSGLAAESALLSDWGMALEYGLSFGLASVIALFSCDRQAGSAASPDTPGDTTP